MTAEQKTRITQLRKSGIGIKKISDLLGLTRDAVKSYCTRNGIVPDTSTGNNIEFCPCCFQVLVHTPKHKKKRFCSVECKQKWWSVHRDLIKHKTSVTCNCKYCGAEFQKLPSSTQKYCNQKCYFAYRYGGEREKIE